MTQIWSFPSQQEFQHQPPWRIWLHEEGLAGQEWAPASKGLVQPSPCAADGNPWAVRMLTQLSPRTCRWKQCPFFALNQVVWLKDLSITLPVRCPETAELITDAISWIHWVGAAWWVTPCLTLLSPKPSSSSLPFVRLPSLESIYSFSGVQDLGFGKLAQTVHQMVQQKTEELQSVAEDVVFTKPQLWRSLEHTQTFPPQTWEYLLPWASSEDTRLSTNIRLILYKQFL